MYFLRRLAAIPLLLLAISALAFALVRWAPGGPFDLDRSAASPEIERALAARYHLQEPMVQQYARFLAGAVRGDFGPSLKYRSHSVTDIVAQGLPVSVVLGGLSFAFALGVGIPLGMAGASKRGGSADTAWSLVALLAVCVPAFVSGPILVLYLAVRWDLLPVALWGDGWHLVLPVVTLGTYYAGRVARLMREGMREVLGAPHVRAARARGIQGLPLLMRHVFPLAVLPVLTYSGPLLADLLTGSFVVENLFQLPGIGTLTVNSALNRDYPLIVALVLLYGALLLLLNLAVDLAHGWLDPRVRHG
jgi:oligopeptide transport system permease protein